MRRRFLNRSTQALIAANLVVALVLALQLVYPAAPSAAAAATLADDDASLPEFGSTALTPPALAALADMLERPLFYDDRRMPQPPEVKAAPPPPKPLMLSLQGVALAGGSRVAVLRNTSNKLLLQLAEGDMHDGWTLDELTSTSARFSRGPQTAELVLDPTDANSR